MKTLKSIALLLFVVLTISPISSFAAKRVLLDGEISRNEETLYSGVVHTNIKTSASSKYGLQNIDCIEFNPAQSDLYIDAVGAGEYANNLGKTSDTAADFDAADNEKTVIAGINADLWMVSYAHARVIGSGTSYGGYDNAVVKSSLTLPRGFNVYGGEIITSQYMIQETPYEGEFWSFGITGDRTPVIGCPMLDIEINNLTDGTFASGDGLNRLPADNALVVYSDRGCLNNYALDDSYEILINCGDYTITHGSTVSGIVEAVYSSSVKENPVMKDGHIILTARGNRESLLWNYTPGDEVSVSFSVYEKYGRENEQWRNIYSAVGGHMPFVVDGVKRETGTTTGYPSTIVGIKNDGSVAFITDDGRQSGFSTGLAFNDYWSFADDFDLNTAIILDGGGSTTMVINNGGDYNVVNSPSDSSGERTVVNSLILSYGAKRADKDTKKVSVPDPDVDLTSLYFNTDEGINQVAGLIEAKAKRTPEGLLLKADSLVSRSPSVIISYGLPNTSSENFNSSLYDLQYPSVSADEFKYIVVDMKIPSSVKSNLQVHYFTSGNLYSASNDCYSYNFTENDGQFHSYILDLSEIADWNGDIHTLHINYMITAGPPHNFTVTEDDTAVLRSVRLAQSPEQAGRIAEENQSQRENPFSDFDENSWFFDAAIWCNSYNVVNGMNPTEFSAGIFATRGMLVTLLGRINGINETPYPEYLPFSDALTNSWYSAHLDWAVKNAVVSGYPDGTFVQEKSITRQELAQLFYNYAEKIDGIVSNKDAPVSSLDGFSDRNEIGKWALNSMAWAVSAGLMSGTSADTLEPTATATRAQIVQMIYNYVTVVLPALM